MKFDFSNAMSWIAPHFRPAIHYNGRYLVMWGGAGSGKSITAGVKVILRCMATPGHKIFCIRKVEGGAKKSVFAQLIEWTKLFGVYPHCKINLTDKIILFPNKSSIQCIGLDDPEKIKSVPFISGYWFEEATEMDILDFMQCDLRLRGNTPSYKQIIVTFNPIVVSNWVYEKFFTEQQNVVSKCDGRIQEFELGVGDELIPCMTHHSTYRDNPFIDAQYKAVLGDLANRSETDWRVYHEGLWGQVSGTVYSSFDRMRNVSEKAEYDPALDICWTWDFNIGEGKPMSSALCHIRQGRDKDGKLRLEVHVFDEIVMETGDTRTMCDEYKRRGYSIGNASIYGDRSGKSRSSNSAYTDYDLIRAAGAETFRVPGNNPAIRGRHNCVNALLKSASGDVRLFIHPRCKTLIRGLESVTMKSGAMYQEKETYEQHITTALGYLVCFEFPLDKPLSQKTGGAVIF